MSRRNTAILVGTHLIALGAAYSVGGKHKPQADPTVETKPARTKSIARGPRTSGDGDGPALLATFRNEQSAIKSRYEELKATLPVAKNLRAAAAEALANCEASSYDEETVSILKVRLLHWLKQSPADAMDFMSVRVPNSAAADPFASNSLVTLTVQDVLVEVVEAKGILQSLSWLTKDSTTFETILIVTSREMKAGGGFSVFLKLDAAMKGTPCEDIWRTTISLAPIGGATRFTEKERLLEYAKTLPEVKQQQDLLLGFSQSSSQAAEWALGLTENGELPPELATSLKGALGNAVLNAPLMDMDKRVAARRATKGNEKKFRETIISEIVGGDVNHLLVNGRDWRYEFRNGVSSLDEVLTAVRSGLPGIPAEAEEAIHISLYRQLAEENPDKALPLLDGLSEDKRRELLFSCSWNSHSNNNPDDFLRFLNGLPAAETQKEKDERRKGWDWNARGCLSRYGDDYVEWVKALPPGEDKDSAMNSIVWATGEVDSAKSKELSDQFYPKKP